MSSPRTVKLLIQIMKIVSIVYMNIRSERTGNWKLPMYTTNEILPFFSAMKQLCTKYIQKSLDLFKV